ncbi:MAG: UDP-3-O-(3-hydroxymyristoyl)glucosamine N-acyltransferase [Nitrospirae bacterium]|nr:UDP-3-O-(3-hydroxymyristoyl)glucosamine N-acyltransferase [Nitrospirota bacterium]
MNINEFAKIVNGEVIGGNPEKVVTGVSGVREAGEGDITFIASPQYLKYLVNSRASCVIVKEVIPDLFIAQIKVMNPYYAFAKAIECFYPKTPHPVTISSEASISESALIGNGVTIYPFVVVSAHAIIGDNSVIMPGAFIGENTSIGRDCLIYPNVTIREGITIGNRVIIHAGSVIGSDGYGYVLEKGEHYKIPQVGGVVIEEDVEIGSNVSIDRATLGNTLIKRGAKIDNLCQIAHNVSIGEKSLIVSQVGIAGSTEIGDFVILGGQVGVGDHTTIESGTSVAGGAGVMNNNLKKGVYSGTPAIPHAKWLRAQALFAKLPEMNKKIRELEEKMDRLVKGETL